MWQSCLNVRTGRTEIQIFFQVKQTPVCILYMHLAVCLEISFQLKLPPLKHVLYYLKDPEKVKLNVPERKCYLLGYYLSFWLTDFSTFWFNDLEQVCRLEKLEKVRSPYPHNFYRSLTVCIEATKSALMPSNYHVQNESPMLVPPETILHWGEAMTCEVISQVKVLSKVGKVCAKVGDM